MQGTGEGIGDAREDGAGVRLFITWARHARRSSELARRFGAEPVFIYPKRSRGLVSTAHRYVSSFVRTLILLFKARPTLVFVVNQPIFLVLAAYLYGQLRGVPYIVDHHSGAFNHRVNRWALPLLRLLCRNAALSFVTNEHHEAILRRWRARSLIVADVPFHFSQSEEANGERFEGLRHESGSKPYVVMVSTFSNDEPLPDVLEAARSLPELHFFVTGSLRKADRTVVMRAPLNVTFTNFLPDRDYVRLLEGSRAVLALTTRNHTLQRGAYEALSLAKPVITSDWPLLREVFCRGATFTPNDSASIRVAIESTLAREESLIDQARNLRDQRRTSFAHLVSELEKELQMFEGAGVGALS